MENQFLKFYGEHSISPVHQDISDWGNFIKKRRKLYRQLGIPWQCLENKEILEFGTGGGYNALALVKSGIKHIDMVEPNETGRKEIVGLFTAEKIEKDRYSIFPDMMENFCVNKKYDFVIAELFIMHLDNWKECLKILKKYCKKDSIVITTCSDEICYYVERMKRFIAHYMSRNINVFDKKRDYLIKIFEPQLNSIGITTRPIKDWVEDQLLNEATICEHLMNINDVISEFEDEFDVLGMSQNIFTDYSWYKDTEYDYISEYKKQYNRKKHMFMIAGGYEETIRNAEDNLRLENACKYVNDLARKYETDNEFDLKQIIRGIERVSAAASDETVVNFNNQCIEIFERLYKDDFLDLSQYKIWCECFGKSSQYISLVKK